MTGRLLVVLTNSGADKDTGTVSVLDASDLSVVGTWTASDLGSVDVSDDGSYVVTAGNENHLVQVWDTEDTSEPAQVLKNARGAGTLSTVALSPDAEASRVAVTTASGMVYVWERASGRLLAVVTGPLRRRERGGVRPHGDRPACTRRATTASWSATPATCARWTSAT